MDNHGPKITFDAGEISEDEVLKVLVATDCHLGYEETDRVIGDDSFITFEEVLLKAFDENVDIILLGGDLFHYNNPSQKSMNKCIELLREYTLGGSGVKFELLSRADVFNHTLTKTPNFLDDNINVSVPVFSIHGNHDDPSGIGHHSCLDTLSSAGLINYFGKWTDLGEIKVKPIIIKKGQTYLALYGLSHIRDDRLCRLLLDKKVTFLEPEMFPDRCFRLLILHQNRADRGPKRFISESLLPSSFDLVIWGHEHDCEINLQWNIEKEFYVVQPGSTVATSLSEGEAIPKHIGALRLFGNYFKWQRIKLNTVRPFIWKSIRLMDIPITEEDTRQIKSDIIRERCTQEVENMIKEAEQLLTGHPKQPKLPLIRLRCEFDDESQLFNVVKFGQQFMNRVATPNLEVVRLKKIPVLRKTNDPFERTIVAKRLKELYCNDTDEHQNFTECINRIVYDYFTEHPDSQMTVLTAAEMGFAVEKYIEKDETDIIHQTVEGKLKRLLKEMAIHIFNNENDILRELQRLKEEEEKLLVENEREFGNLLDRTISKTTKQTARADENYSGTNDSTLGEIKKSRLCVTKEEKSKCFATLEMKAAENFVSDSDSDERDERRTSGEGQCRGTSRARGRGKGRGRGRGGRGSDMKPAGNITARSPEKAPIHEKLEKKTPSKFLVTRSIVYDDEDDSSA